MDYHTEDRWKRYQQSVGTNRCYNKMVQQVGTTRCYTTRWDNIKYQRTHNVVKYTVSDCASNTPLQAENGRACHTNDDGSVH